MNLLLKIAGTALALLIVGRLIYLAIERLL
jgi:hypothetical protein